MFSGFLKGYAEELVVKCPECNRAMIVKECLESMPVCGMAEFIGWWCEVCGPIKEVWPKSRKLASKRTRPYFAQNGILSNDDDNTRNPLAPWGIQSMRPTIGNPWVLG